MRAFLAYERRLQDLETRLNNMSRFGDVTDVKFDQDKGRWYVKMQDGEGEGTTFNSDWLPWKSFAHGSIKVSMPPKKGMKVAMTSPNGQPEMAYAEPFHNGPDAKSPHDKEDEVVMTIQNEDGSESMKVHQSKGEHTVTIGDTVFSIKKDGVTVTTKAVTVNADTATVTTKNDTVVKSTSGNITLDAPVFMPKGFTAGEGGTGTIATLKGALLVEKDITSNTKVKAPVLVGQVQSA